MPPKQDFGQWLRKRRIELGYTQAELAAVLGVGKRRLEYWEADEKESGEKPGRDHPSQLEEIGVRLILAGLPQKGAMP